MAWLYGYSIRHPRTVVVAAVLVVLGIAPGVFRLKIRTDGHALVPPDAPDIHADRAIRDRFGTEDPIVVLIRTDDSEGIFNTRTLQLVQDLTREFQGIPGIRRADLFSLDTEHNHRVKPGTLEQVRFLDPVPTTKKELDQLRDDLNKIGLFNGTLVSDDGRSASILLGVPHGASRTDLYRTVQDIIGRYGEVPETLDVIGAPVAEALLGTHILEDLGVPAAVLGHRVSSRDGDAGKALPRSLYEVRLFVGRYLGLAPIAVGLMGLMFLVAFRSAAAALLPLGEIGAALLVVFGLMGWFGVPIYLTIAVLPIILTVTGVTDEIHVFTHYTQLLCERPDEPHVTIVRRALDEMWRPVLKASLTTAVGFLSFAISEIKPVWAFGIFTATGLVFCMFWSFSVVPAMLVLIDPKHFVSGARRARGDKRPGRGSLASRMARLPIRFRYAVVAAAVLVLALSPMGLRRVVVQDSWIDGFSPDSTFHQTTQFFNQHFLGTHMLLVCVEAPHHHYEGRVDAGALDHHHGWLPRDITARPEELIGDRIEFSRPSATSASAPAGRPPARPDLRDHWFSRVESAVLENDRLRVAWTRDRGSPQLSMRLTPGETVEFRIIAQPLKSPETIRRIKDLEAFIETRREDTVGGVLGTAKYLETIHLMSRGLAPEWRTIPDRADKIEWLWEQYKRIRGEDRLGQLVDPEYARSLVTVFLKNANFVAVGRLMREIRAYEREHLAPQGIKLHLGGDVAVSQTLIDAIVSTQVKSLAISLVGDFAVVALVSRSLTWGLFSIIPCCVVVLLNFAIMGWVGMPLGVATSMFSGMTLGVGVDYAIHLMERVRLCQQDGLDLEGAIRRALISTGRPLLIDALAVSIGFGIMMLSQVPANARLGGLVVMSIVNSLVATLVLLPALLRVFRPAALQRTTISSDDSGVSAGL